MTDPIFCCFEQALVGRAVRLDVCQLSYTELSGRTERWSSKYRVMVDALARRALLGSCLALVCAHPLRAGDDFAAWEAFKARFVSSEGRVRDFANEDISHSEGQAWALLLAARRGDAEAFQRVQSWTYRTLGIRRDALLAWRYRPGPNGGVDDLNNATDADLYHAHALLIAHRRWPDRGYLGLAQRVGHAIEARNVRWLRDRRLLIPGATGFEFASHVEVNPSYYAFAALDALDAAFPGRGWAEVARDGEALLASARFGQFGLPPDWLRVDRRDAALSPVAGRGDRFGYDAIRVPLNLIWGRRAAHPIVDAAARFWSDPGFGHLPAWARLNTNEVSPYPAGSGIAAIAELVLARQAGWLGSPPPAGATVAGSYYDAVLGLLTREAWRDSRIG